VTDHSDAIARDFVILASHLRRAAHSIDFLLKEMRLAREPGTLSTRSAAADGQDFQSITDGAVRPWIDRRYNREAGSCEIDSEAEADPE